MLHSFDVLSPDDKTMILRLKNVNNLVNKLLGFKNEKCHLTQQNRSDWNWIVKGKMIGNTNFHKLYNILKKKMESHDMFILI